MGAGGSKANNNGMTRVASSSAAFGRLRIDSPGAATPGSAARQQSMRRRQQMRLATEQQAGGGGASPMIGSGHIFSEQSPLMASNNNHRHLDTIPSGMELEAASTSSPPVAVWIVPALCCALAYALYNIFIKKGSSHINPVLGGVILQLVAAVLGCCLLLFLVVCT